MTGTIKRVTSNFQLGIPFFDSPNWGAVFERDMNIIDAVLSTAGVVSSIVGPWEPNTAYSVDDRVVDTDDQTVWQCAVAHTSGNGTFAQDRAANPTYWDAVSASIVVRGAFVPGADYFKGDFVYDGAEFLAGIVLEPFTGGATLRDNISDIGVIYDIEDTPVVRYDEAQVLTAEQQGIARDNIDVGTVAGYRNKIINGNFDIYQSGATGTVNFVADRWGGFQASCTISQQRISFALGDGSVPDNPKYGHRVVVTSTGAAAEAAHLSQKIERVQTLANGKATITFYARADAAKDIFVELLQNFGTGGSPSAAINRIGATTITLATGFQRYDIVVDVPSIIGKTLGTDNNDNLQLVFWMSAGTDHNARTDSLGTQSGTFDFAHISVVPGDASDENDPFAIRPLAVEYMLAERFRQTFTGEATNERLGVGVCTSATAANVFVPFRTRMRTIPTLGFIGSYALLSNTGATIAVTGITLGAGTTTRSAILLPTCAGGLVAGDATQLLLNDAAALLVISCEL